MEAQSNAEEKNNEKQTDESSRGAGVVKAGRSVDPLAENAAQPEPKRLYYLRTNSRSSPSRVVSGCGGQPGM